MRPPTLAPARLELCRESGFAAPSGRGGPRTSATVRFVITASDPLASLLFPRNPPIFSLLLF
jgi:hypothetical protein